MTKMIQCPVVLAAVITLACAAAVAQSSGSATYIPKCAGCHGVNGIVASEFMRSRGTPGATDPNIMSLSAKQMFNSVKNGTPGMPPFKGRLTDAEIMNAVAYFRELGTRASGPPTQEQQNSNAEAIKENEIIKALNADLMICAQDIKDADTALDAETKTAKYGEVESLMLRDTQTKPDASILWVRLGQAQAGLMKYADAESSLNRALELESTATHQNAKAQSWANAELEKIHARSEMVAAPAPPPMPDIAPPPPSADAPPPTIAIGQTRDQVSAAFGQPVRIAKLGVKEIFYYKDMKVTFTNGKVSNVE
jgi:mono/diheme cytochrome c family protein